MRTCRHLVLVILLSVGWSEGENWRVNLCIVLVARLTSIGSMMCYELLNSPSLFYSHISRSSEINTIELMRLYCLLLPDDVTCQRSESESAASEASSDYTSYNHCPTITRKHRTSLPNQPPLISERKSQIYLISHSPRIPNSVSPGCTPTSSPLHTAYRKLTLVSY